MAEDGGNAAEGKVNITATTACAPPEETVSSHQPTAGADSSPLLGPAPGDLRSSVLALLRRVTADNAGQVRFASTTTAAAGRPCCLLDGTAAPRPNVAAAGARRALAETETNLGRCSASSPSPMTEVEDRCTLARKVQQDALEVAEEGCDARRAAGGEVGMGACFVGSGADGVLCCGEHFVATAAAGRDSGSATQFWSELIRRGADGDLATPTWVANHLRWIVWKLAATERRFPDCFPHGYLTAETVTRQLQYRYDVEIMRARKPALKAILQGDAAACRPLILCVSRVYSPEDLGARRGTAAAVIEVRV
ncbi:unnamed protein product [Sphacelaria rigidula]